MRTRRPAFDASSGQWSVASGQLGHAQADSSSSSSSLATSHWPLATSGVPRRAAATRRGVTLLELLIVMTIMLMVTAAAIPVMMPAMQNRRMREASRLTSSFISGARARAIETGRPAGVMFERFNGLPMAMQLSYVEVPPPYSGDTLNSTVIMEPAPPSAPVRITGFTAGDSSWLGLVRFGDQIRLNFKGPLYTLRSVAPGVPDPAAGRAVTAPTSGSPWHLADSTGAAPPLPVAYSAGVAFQIIRQPVRSSATPLQLPEGTVVDLISSGSTTLGNFNVNASVWPPAVPLVPFNPVIMFSPNGTVDSLTAGTAGTPLRPSSAIFLLIGRRELMFDITASNPASPTAADLINKNVSDPPSATGTSAPPQHFWVTIAHQTGQVSVAEVAANRQDQATATDSTSLSNAVNASLAQARAFAQSPQSAGGR